MKLRRVASTVPLALIPAAVALAGRRPCRRLRTSVDRRRTLLHKRSRRRDHAPRRLPKSAPCTGTTDGPGFRAGYLVDCEGTRLCKLRQQPPAAVPTLVNVNPPATASPEERGRTCIVRQNDAQKVYLINTCSLHLNFKFSASICISNRAEKYSCSASLAPKPEDGTQGYRYRQGGFHRYDPKTWSYRERCMRSSEVSLRSYSWRRCLSLTSCT